MLAGGVVDAEHCLRARVRHGTPPCSNDVTSFEHFRFAADRCVVHYTSRPGGKVWSAVLTDLAPAPLPLPALHLLPAPQDLRQRLSWHSAPLRLLQPD